jgi:hypothetical protein
VGRLKRALRIIRDSGTPLPPCASDIDLNDRSEAAVKLDSEALRRMVYRAALEAYRKLARPVKSKEVRQELFNMLIYVDASPPSPATVAKLLKTLSSRDYYGCEPPLLKVDEGYIPREAYQEGLKPNTLDPFI